jgi:hypothetical protein
VEKNRHLQQMGQFSIAMAKDIAMAGCKMHREGENILCSFRF